LFFSHLRISQEINLPPAWRTYIEHPEHIRGFIL
jgi:hypothetical protein